MLFYYLFTLFHRYIFLIQVENECIRLSLLSEILIIVKRYFKNNRYDGSEGGLVLIWYENDLVEKLLEKQSNLIGS